MPLCHFTAEQTLPQNDFIWLISYSFGDLNRAALTVLYWIFTCGRLTGYTVASYRIPWKILLRTECLQCWCSFVPSVVNESMFFACITEFSTHTWVCFKASDCYSVPGKKKWRKQHPSQLDTLKLNYWPIYMTLKYIMLDAIYFPICNNCNIMLLRNCGYTNTWKANLDDNKRSFLYCPTYLSEPQFILSLQEKQNIYINIFSVLILLLKLWNESAII